MPVRRFRAPGRVNLIGGHVDYHDGVVVAMAIDRSIDATVEPTDDGFVRVTSAGFDGEVTVAADGGDDPSTIEPAWGRVIGGVVRVLAEDGVVCTGMRAHLAADLPVGGGLSSSAAIEVLIARAVAASAGVSVDPLGLALWAQRAEHVATGVPCGIQDQVSIVWGGVIALDVRTRTVSPLTLPAGTSVVVVDSGVPRALEGSPWAAYRAETFATARRLGHDVLRDAHPDEVASDPRARHVVAEIARAEEFIAALGRSDATAAGELMIASHASSRDDFGSSTVELDRLVDELVAAGAHGARLTGGGFGGCVVALVPSDRAATIVDHVVEVAAASTGRVVRGHLVSPAPGARELT